MKAINFISSRFNTAKNMPRSVRIMRLVAGVGVAVAVISLVLALAIGRGFEKVYRKSLLDFNAHVVIMGAGEIEDPSAVLDELRILDSNEDRREIASEWGWLAPVVGSIEGAIFRMSDLHEDLSYRFEPDSLTGRAWDAIDPSRIMPVLPQWILVPYARFIGAMERSITNRNVFLYREALIIGSGGIKGVVIKGIEPGRDGSTGGMKIELLEGVSRKEEMMKRARGKDVPVIVGRALAGSMGIEGSPKKVRMLIPKAEGNGGERFKDVVVVGTFESGMYDYDAQFVLMNIGDARELFGAEGDTVTGIELRLDDPERSEQVARAAERVLGPRFRAVTWQELNSDLLAAVKLEKLVITLIMGIMLIVAALNIIGALVLTMLHRMREISVLKALGLDERRIARLFTRGGMMVGMRGVMAGLVVGLGLALLLGNYRIIPLEAEIYLVDSLPIDISWLICGIITLFCAGTIYITSRVAAKRLARVPPAEGLARAR